MRDLLLHIIRIGYVILFGPLIIFDYQKNRKKSDFIIIQIGKKMPKNQNNRIQGSDEENSNYLPDSDSSSERLNNQQQSEYQQINEGKWSEDEKMKFISFLLYYEEIFASSTSRKHHRIFKKISLFLKSRKPRQCRSHYQKLTKRFKDVKDLKNHFIQKYGAKQFVQEYLKITSQFEPIPKIEEQYPTDNYEPPKHVGVQTDFEPLYNNYNLLFHHMQSYAHPLFYNPSYQMSEDAHSWKNNNRQKQED